MQLHEVQTLSVISIVHFHAKFHGSIKYKAATGLTVGFVNTKIVANRTPNSGRSQTLFSSVQFSSMLVDLRFPVLRS